MYLSAWVKRATKMLTTGICLFGHRDGQSIDALIFCHCRPPVSDTTALKPNGNSLKHPGFLMKRYTTSLDYVRYLKEEFVINTVFDTVRTLSNDFFIFHENKRYRF